MIAFLTAVFFLLITPGPGVLSVAGVGSGFGFKPGMRYMTGLFFGTNLVAVLVVTGLAAIVLSVPEIRTVLLYLSVAYLCWLAAKIAFSGSRIAFIHSKNPPGFWNGIALQIINPKAYVVNTSLFTGFAFLPDNLAGEIALKFVIINTIWIPIHFLWLYLGITLRRLELPKNVQFAINIGMAISLLAVMALALLYSSSK